MLVTYGLTILELFMPLNMKGQFGVGIVLNNKWGMSYKRGDP